MNEHLAAWDKIHEDAKRSIQRLLTSTEEGNADFVRLANWCLSTDLSRHAFMPTGYAQAFHSSVEAERFFSTLHQAMVDDTDMTFAMSSTGPCFEFCSPHDLDIVAQANQNYSRNSREPRNWSVAQFIHEAESFHHARGQRVDEMHARLQRWRDSSAS